MLDLGGPGESEPDAEPMLGYVDNAKFDNEVDEAKGFSHASVDNEALGHEELGTNGFPHANFGNEVFGNDPGHAVRRVPDSCATDDGSHPECAQRGGAHGAFQKGSVQLLQAWSDLALSSDSPVGRASRAPPANADSGDRRDLFPLPCVELAALEDWSGDVACELLLQAVNFCIAGLNCLEAGGRVRPFGVPRRAGPSAPQRAAQRHVVERVVHMFRRFEHVSLPASPRCSDILRADGGGAGSSHHCKRSGPSRKGGHVLSRASARDVHELAPGGLVSSFPVGARRGE